MIWKYPQDFKKVSYKPGQLAEYVGGDGILMARIQVSTVVSGSVHNVEQLSLVLEGEFDITIGDETKRVQKGDSF